MIVSDLDVRTALDLDDLRSAMSDVLADFSAGRCVQPVRTTIPVTEHGGYLYVMPARTRTGLGVKLVTLYPGNVGLPTHHATVLLFDPSTGAELATLDGSSITALRTAAVSAVAVDRLADPAASTLAILGTGVQAASHLDALRRVRAFRHVRTWSPHRAAAFAASHEGVIAAETAEAATQGADVIVTVTTAREPILRGDWLRPGTLVVAVGAPRPDWRELDDTLVAASRLVVDSRAAAEAESGDIIRGIELGNVIAAELGEVIAGTAPGHEDATAIVVFKSLGLAVEDVAAAELVLRRRAKPPHEPGDRPPAAPRD